MGQVDDFIAAARGEVGKPYTTHRDCSGFTAWCARQADFYLPEGSVAQYQMGRSVTDRQPGDLVFWDTFGPAPGHVAICETSDTIIHALNESRGIIRSRWDAPMGGPYMGARRVIADDGAPDPPKQKKRRPKKRRRR